MTAGPLAQTAGAPAALPDRKKPSAAVVRTTAKKQPAALARTTAAPRTEDLLTVDPLKIELGYGLIPMADARQGGDLLARIQVIRQQTATKMGFIVPVIRIVDNMRLRPNEYAVRLRYSSVFIASSAAG